MYRTLFLAATLTLVSAVAVAQRPVEPRLEWEVRALGLRFENFFQAPDGAPERDVDATRAQGKVSYRLVPDRPTALFATAGLTSYEGDLETSVSFGLGLESDTRRREWMLGVEHTRDQPVFDVGDELDFADVLRVAGSYGVRVTDAWQVTGLGEWQRQEFDLTTGKDNDFYSVGGAVRYRGWGYLFSPEVGVEIGRRDADDPNEDHDQRDVWLKVRSLPTPNLYLSLRHRLRNREYTVDDPLAGNFGREDDRKSWTLNARYRLTDWAALDLYYDYLDAGSDKESRVFTTQILGFGLSVGRF